MAVTSCCTVLPASRGNFCSRIQESNSSFFLFYWGSRASEVFAQTFFFQVSNIFSFLFPFFLFLVTLCRTVLPMSLGHFCSRIPRVLHLFLSFEWEGTGGGGGGGE